MLARKRQLFFFVSIEDGHDLHRRRLESKVRLNRKIWRIEKHIKKKKSRRKRDCKRENQSKSNVIFVKAEKWH